eukprot:1575905-Pleurochrysis_carterae.AAC.1
MPLVPCAARCIEWHAARSCIAALWCCCCFLVPCEIGRLETRSHSDGAPDPAAVAAHGVVYSCPARIAAESLHRVALGNASPSFKRRDRTRLALCSALKAANRLE